MPIMPAQCATCPFRKGGWEHVRPLLENRALNEATPICHSTGKGALVKKIPRQHICRGARDLQLQCFHAMGVIAAPTDEAWADACRRMGIRNIATEAA
jgi:hypothetical protein